MNMLSSKRFQVLDGPKSLVRGGQRVWIKDTEAQSGQCEIYSVSAIPAAPDTEKPETLVFRANAEWDITDWSEVCGIPYFSIPDAIQLLYDVLSENKSYDIMDSPMFADGIISGIARAFTQPPSDYYVDEDEDYGGL